MPPQPPASVDDLGLQGCLNLWALLTGQERRLAIAPTVRMTLIVMNLLREQGVIEVPWPNAIWAAKPEAEQTPLEGLQWSLIWSIYEPPLLLAALEDYLISVGRDELGLAIRLRLWIEIGSAEAEHFFEMQLEKHGFPLEWAQDIIFVYQDHQGQLSLAQWRYCAWAAVRRGASLAMQQGLVGADRVSEAIYHELRQRASIVASGAWSRCSLPPFQPTPQSALARGYTRWLTKLGMVYWTAIPSLEALLESPPP